MKPIEVTEIQRKLLGIKENEIGFKIYTPKIDDKADEIKLPPTPPFEIQFNSTSNSSFANSPQMFSDKSSTNTSLFANNSLNSLQNNSFNSSLNSTFNSTSASSWIYHRNNSASSSPLNGEDGKFNSSSFRLRRSTPGKSKPIVDGESLNKYLKEFEEREERTEELRQAEKQQQNQSYTSSPWGMASSRINSNEQVGYQFFTNTSSGKEEIEKQLSLTTSPSAKALDSVS